MFIVSNRLFVADTYADEIQSRFAARRSAMKEQPGFIRMQVQKSMGKDTPWVIQTQWQDQASFKTWVQSDDFKAAHANPLPQDAFTAPGGIEQHLVVVDSAD
jgi:heme-degrading monooxygenase HmoA